MLVSHAVHIHIDPAGRRNSSQRLTDPVAITLSICSVMCAVPVFWAPLSGFLGPDVTGRLTDLTGDAKLAMWVVGVPSLAAAAAVVGLGAKPPHVISATGQQQQSPRRDGL
ncbi:hypothetical protein [Mycobacterium sp. ACS1612]|uniref:hypothetical protein n=1 Tax=Mycobacterium sp. ACS1612 TaxID=1834117 RepID=UPI0018D42CF6|nr:hypothetical protein [Mycobacterium sp. ACS1612]